MCERHTKQKIYNGEVMKIALGADHGGYEMKNVVASYLKERGYTVLDYGTFSDESVDYPAYGVAVGEAVVNGDAELGVALCGSGIGIAIAANKVSGVRAATAHNVTSARLARVHNNANVLCLGARLLSDATILEALQSWLEASFEPTGRHQRRVQQLDAL